MQKYKFIFSGPAKRLDRYLSEVLGGDFSRAKLQKLILQGRVRINNVVAGDKSRKLSAKDEISVRFDQPKLVARPDVDFKIVFEDSDVMVIDKPPGLVVHTSPDSGKPSLAAGLIARRPGLPSSGDPFRPGIVHRLDADTSGLMIIAKNEPAMKFLQDAFRRREVEKEYLALVCGKLESRHGIFNKPIGRHSGRRKLSAGFGRSAETEYWVENYYSDGVDIFTLIRVRLHTGRTHQIRVHMESAGFPLAGDKLYGNRGGGKSAEKFFPRQFLHACRLALALPSGGRKEFVSPLPEDLQGALNHLNSISQKQRI